jgi:hypothetical protein
MGMYYHPALMPPIPLRPNIECFTCPEGNRFMQHVRTERRPRREAETTEAQQDSFAIYKCSTCGRWAEEAFDPESE